MKKLTLPVVAFCIAAFLFCCKTYKETIVHEEEYSTELSDYLNSAKGVMHTAPVPQASSTAASPAVKEHVSRIPLKHRAWMLPVSSVDPPAADEPVHTKKQERKAVKAMLKKQIADGEEVGIAIGLLILYIILGILIIVGLYLLIANAANSTSNNSSNGGSGSNSNSGNSGNSGSGTSGSNSGCYVATMVYGSYDAPEVMVLRRFRDHTLSHSKTGRAFIRWYYSWSPGFVAKYHHLSWLHAIIKLVLNRLVKFLL